MSKYVLLLVLISSAFAGDKIQSWTFTRGLDKELRGGNSKGVPVEFDQSISSFWKELQEAGISSYEKDRRAILALQGEFKTSFEFMETIMLDSKLDLDTPYASWGTEFVKVVEDRGDFISLQHILVMTVVKDDGTLMGPYVVKHWRQDWTWEPEQRVIFQGDNHWKVEKMTAQESKGIWKWTVFQVDDTPRYSGIGKWNHLKSTSLFETDLLSRPLPRREFSVRSDYKVLMGRDTLVLTPTGWYHEQRNLKHKGKLGGNNQLLAREIGHNSYKRIKGYDFQVGYDYWSKSSPYWADVRFVWDEFLKENSEFELRKKVNGKMLFEYHFFNAEDEDLLKLDKEARRGVIRLLIKRFFK